MRILLALVVACSSPAAPAPWLADEAAAFQRAREDRRAVLLDLTATWSMPSIEVSARLDRLRPELDRDFVAVRIDVSRDDTRVQELRTRYEATQLPAVILVETDGTVLGRITHGASEPELRELLGQAARRRKR